MLFVLQSNLEYIYNEHTQNNKFVLFLLFVCLILRRQSSKEANGTYSTCTLLVRTRSIHFHSIRKKRELLKMSLPRARKQTIKKRILFSATSCVAESYFCWTNNMARRCPWMMLPFGLLRFCVINSIVVVIPF